MRVFGIQFGAKPALPEARQTVTVSSPDFMEVLGLNAMINAASDVPVTIDTALSVPAISGAVNFLAGTMAGLPLNLFERDGENRKRVTDTPLAAILHDAVNDEVSSFEWRKGMFENVFTGGRGLTFIERNAAGQVINLWPLMPGKTTIRRKDGKKRYEYRDGTGPVKVYEASEVIDIPFMLKSDGVGHRGPIAMNRDVIGLAIAATRYGARFFNNGGVPPFVVTGNFQSMKAIQAAQADFDTSVKTAGQNGRSALTVPTGVEIKSLGIDPEKMQLTETKRFLIEEIARIYSMPPVFLQDLTHGTFSNTEQQDLHLVKHTLKRWVEAFEQEVNLKLFGREDRSQFVEMNMDGLLRGDFKTRMEGYATAVQNGILAPGEVRQMENKPAKAGDDRLFMQGAMVPIDQLQSGNNAGGAGNGA
jgi:HK97 family phage portal protein